jgi:hypothetical protein
VGAGERAGAAGWAVAASAGGRVINVAAYRASEDAARHLIGSSADDLRMRLDCANNRGTPYPLDTLIHARVLESLSVGSRKTILQLLDREIKRLRKQLPNGGV